MRCISKRFALILFGCVLLLSGCGRASYPLPYSGSSFLDNSFSLEGAGGRADGFAERICVVSGDVLKEGVSIENAGAAALFDVKNAETLYAKSAHEKMYPASLTKVMTALVALENGSLDQVLTATDAVKVTTKGAATCGLKAGDTMTLDQALHIMMISSANDVPLLIADCIGGGVDNFLQMMNDRALELGATNTHFTNPHGLTDQEHYTTAYDMYLIFNEALKYDTFSQMLNMPGYQTTYHDKNGKEIPYNTQSTNRFFTGQAQAPANVTVLGGKPGTTNLAGHCLLLHCKDTRGNSYIAIVMRCTDADTLYAEMVELLGNINN